MIRVTRTFLIDRLDGMLADLAKRPRAEPPSLHPIRDLVKAVPGGTAYLSLLDLGDAYFAQHWEKATAERQRRQTMLEALRTQMVEAQQLDPDERLWIDLPTWLFFFDQGPLYIPILGTPDMQIPDLSSVLSPSSGGPPRPVSDLKPS
jgi:hypothetical protein